MREYGYCRISTNKQSLSRQVKNIISEYPNAEIVEEVYTGTTTSRPQWLKLISRLKMGDTVVVDSVSRMSRCAEEGISDYMELYNKGVNLIFLKEPYINTENYKQALSNTINEVGNEIADIYIMATNKVLMILARKQIEQAFAQAEKEVLDMRKRTSESLQTLKNNGKAIGGAVNKGRKYNVKKEILIKDIIKKYSQDFGGTLNDRAVIKMCNGDVQTKVSRNTYYKYKKQL